MDVIHAHRRRKMKRTCDRQNFKRKVQDGEISPQHIAVQWRLSYPNGKISKDLEWRSDADLLILFDLVAKKPRLALTSSAGPFLVQDDKAKVLSIDELEPPRATPQLTNDVLRLIFAQLVHWKDKIHCRLVCKQWEKVISGEDRVWKLGINFWNSDAASEFQKFKKILLLGISEERAYKLFYYERPDVFVEICRYLRVGVFTLTPNHLYVHKKLLAMKDFIECWRNKVIEL